MSAGQQIPPPMRFVLKKTKKSKNEKKKGKKKKKKFEKGFIPQIVLFVC
jgi:hypothetical protein